MPNQTPVSRYFLIGIAVAMFCSAVPVADSWFSGLLENWRDRTPALERSVRFMDGMPSRVRPLSPLR
jgi:hypothetical protein